MSVVGAPIRIGHRNLDAEADRNDAEQRHDEGLDPAEAEVLHPQDQEHVEGRDQDAELERNAEQEVEPDRRADDLGKIGRADRDLRHHPQRPRYRAWKSVAAGLRQVAAGRDPQPRAQRLQEDRHQVGEQRNGQQRVPELRSTRERGRPIARVHVADGDEIAGSEKGRELLPQRPLRPRGDRAEDFGERRLAPPPSPAGSGKAWRG